jgi:spermidine synthase
MQKKLLILSFIEGAAVMAAELCGAKLLAPIFGSSLYVWASVMGITLAALAIGYFFGGLISEKSAEPKKKLFQILIIASLLLLLMPVTSYYLIPRISYLSFLPAVVISTIALLFFPVFLLGVSSPLFIVLQIKQNLSPGKASGTVYAISTLGGIFATFLSGFYLIPGIGLNITLLIFGGTLFLSSILVFKLFKVTQALIFILFLYLNLQFSFKKINQFMVADSLLGHLEVENFVSNKQEVRLLKINSIIQTEMGVITKRSVSGYIALLDTLVQPIAPSGNALVLGLGGGLSANLLIEKKYKVTGVEFDERIIEASKKYFYLDPSVSAVCEDARYYLNHCDETFDLVLFDVFKAEEQPGHILTMESLEQLKKNLKPDAKVYVNWHGYTNKILGRGTSILYNTLVKSGFYVAMYCLSKDENHRNIVFAASLKNNLNGTKSKYQLKEELAAVNLVNTDDKPVLEKYNAGANKAWRTNYLRYYQNNQ